MLVAAYSVMCMRGRSVGEATVFHFGPFYVLTNQYSVACMHAQQTKSCVDTCLLGSASKTPAAAVVLLADPNKHVSTHVFCLLGEASNPDMYYTTE